MNSHGHGRNATGGQSSNLRITNYILLVEEKLKQNAFKQKCTSRHAPGRNEISRKGRQQNKTRSYTLLKRKNIHVPFLRSCAAGGSVWPQYGGGGGCPFDGWVTTTIPLDRTQSIWMTYSWCTYRYLRKIFTTDLNRQNHNMTRTRLSSAGSMGIFCVLLRSLHNQQRRHHKNKEEPLSKENVMA